MRTRLLLGRRRDEARDCVVEPSAGGLGRVRPEVPEFGLLGREIAAQLSLAVMASSF